MLEKTPVGITSTFCSALMGTALAIPSAFGEDEAPEWKRPKSHVIIDEAIFYDGYARLFDAPVPEDVQRLRNDLVTRKLPAGLVRRISGSVQLDVLIGARCDNYDRIGSVALAFVPKGQTTYDPSDVERVELGRFITPFMDKNKEPYAVPYTFDISHLRSVFKDWRLRREFDFWLELELFGVPYAANQQVEGCAGRNDVFEGTVALSYGHQTGAESSSEEESEGFCRDFRTLVPLAYRLPFNNYQEGASDAIGTTRRTFSFTLDKRVRDAQLTWVISNHGAQRGGEEYIRREHFVYVDGELVSTFVPGRTSCEPFRHYNTQPNGIYSRNPRTDEEWQSFSNWCPGDVIDTRSVSLDWLSPGPHEVVVDVPDAVFTGADGNFPLSVYVQY